MPLKHKRKTSERRSEVTNYNTTNSVIYSSNKRFIQLPSDHKVGNTFVVFEVRIPPSLLCSKEYDSKKIKFVKQKSENSS